ncbi:response regulator transcription factor [Halomonas sp. PAMB 3264]|uniref:response regulator transcription factor n=1 Tax=Halomonas sp. PAMB 3264 TaxID=3075222 RepID=UPI00289FC24D|nr:response regulator transcription factor [Halomonas sp. PAMB 3264]WNL42988.1 response regulator transcription factor [Halomonas sp. PAMB 3264]
MIEKRPRIAIIEDNEDLREELLFYLTHRGFSTWGVESAEAFWKQLHRQPVEIVLVDLGLPGESGFSVAQFLHELTGYGVVIVTARGDHQAKLQALNLGADLFLVKPINFAALALALERLGERLLDASGGSTLKTVPSSKSGWYISSAGDHLVAPNGPALPLSAKESELLDILVSSTHQIFTRQSLHDLLFEYEPESELHRIDVILSRLRQKARRHGLSLPIRTIFGKGIVFVGDTSR